MNYYDENGKDKLAGFQFHDKEKTEVLRIEHDGEVIWQGRKVESDDQFKAAMIAMADALKDGMRRVPLVRLARYEIAILEIKCADKDGNIDIEFFANELQDALAAKNVDQP